MDQVIIKSKHDKYAPYWAVILFLLCVIGLSTNWVDFGKFWKGYVLDMTGPAWNYILVRGLFTSKADNRWIRLFTPVRTLLIFIGVCFGIEIMQYFKVYDATFDYWDFTAYLVILIPVFLLDISLTRKVDLAYSKELK
jgi:hypothetical protein